MPYDRRMAWARLILSVMAAILAFRLLRDDSATCSASLTSSDERYGKMGLEGGNVPKSETRMTNERRGTMR